MIGLFLPSLIDIYIETSIDLACLLFVLTST
jgi:hypothetical protein